MDSEGSFLDNYTVLQELWDLSKDDASDPSMKACIIVVHAQFKNFSHYFGTHLDFLLLQHSDNPSKPFSHRSCVLAKTVATFQHIRDDHSFDLLGVG